MSNTFALYERGWLGCYIEGLPTRFADLQRNITRPGMHLVQRFVRTKGPDSLDAILADKLPPSGLDVLSIDIDSDDLAILEALQAVRPRAIVIEFNPTIPFDTHYRNPTGKNRGNSALSIWEHAKTRGYDLVAVTHRNLVLIDQSFNAGAFKAYELHEIAHNSGYRFFFGFDARMMRQIPALGHLDDIA